MRSLGQRKLKGFLNQKLLHIRVLVLNGFHAHCCPKCTLARTHSRTALLTKGFMCQAQRNIKIYTKPGNPIPIASSPPAHTCQALSCLCLYIQNWLWKRFGHFASLFAHTLAGIVLLYSAPVLVLYSGGYTCMPTTFLSCLRRSALRPHIWTRIFVARFPQFAVYVFLWAK